MLRQPARSVRRADEGERLPLRLALGVIVTVGVVAAIWLMGHIGYRLGFAPLVRVPDLVGEPGGGLATGTMLVISIPRLIFHAGLSQPMWLMVGFVMIAIPAAGLGAAKPATPGGPRIKSEFVAIASAGAVAAMISAVVILWWAGSGVRGELLRDLPMSPAAAGSWIADLRTAAGLDVLAVISSALWTVLVFRLAIPIWLKAIAVSASLFTLAVALTALSISGVASVQAGLPRSICILDDGVGAHRVMLGSTSHHMATLVVYNGEAVVELRNHPDTITVRGRESIVSYLEARAPTEP